MTNALVSINEDALRFISESKKLFIGGKWVESDSGKTIETYNPSTGEVLTSVSEGGEEDINRAVIAARQAFESGPWPKLKPNERASLLLRLGDLMEEHSEELAHLETLDNGLPISVTSNLPKTNAEVFRHYAGLTNKLIGDTIPVSSPGDIFNYTLKEPVGVCGQITPWNGPMNMATWKLAAPLATGNTVVLKPASLTPLVALRMGELIQEAGFPDGVVNIVPGSGSVAGAALSEHPDVDKVSFTGSTAVGKQIIQASAGTIKKTTLELGGKSANIVFADADYDLALKNAAEAFLAFSGQACIAGTRLFVENKIYDKFVDDLAEYIEKNVVLGNVLDPATTMGPLISEKQKNRVLEYIDIGKAEGARLVNWGEATEKEFAKGHFVKPTIMADVTNDMRIAQEEIFGPVVSVIPFESVEEVIKLANDTEYGLAGGVNTTDIRKAHRVAHGMRTGNVWINTYNHLDPASPFGGYKQSGSGKEHGSEVIDMYTETKSIWVNLD